MHDAKGRTGIRNKRALGIELVLCARHEAQDLPAGIKLEWTARGYAADVGSAKGDVSELAQHEDAFVDSSTQGSCKRRASSDTQSQTNVTGSFYFPFFQLLRVTGSCDDKATHGSRDDLHKTFVVLQVFLLCPIGAFAVTPFVERGNEDTLRQNPVVAEDITPGASNFF